jgi:hypothetical protein
MDLINNFINELSKNQYPLKLSIINEINLYVLKKINIILKFYNINNNNKFYLLGDFVNLGIELENMISDKNNDILSIQIKIFSELFNPIINRIKDICVEINMQLIIEFKNLIENIIDSNIEIYKEEKKNLKYFQINSFSKSINYMKGKDMVFEDFGINIKITNYYCKNIFLNLIESIKIFTQNDNLQNKKYDWGWKAFEYKTNINDIDTNLYIENNDINDINDEVINNNKEKIENFKIIQTNINISDNTDLSSNNSNLIIIEDESFSIPINNLQDNISQL